RTRRRLCAPRAAELLQGRAHDRQDPGRAGARHTECAREDQRVRLFRLWPHAAIGQHRPLRAGRCAPQRVVRHRSPGVSRPLDRVVFLLREEPFPGGGRVMTSAADLDVFEAHRALLVAHAYRMLGDLGRAEDMVQEAWLRWSGRHVEVESPRAYLVTVVTRLCFNELDSAKTRREESRGDRLPESVDLDEGGIGRVETLEQISIAFLVVLQRLTPAERAVLLLRDVFDFDYQDIAALVGKSEPACRKLLERARQHVTEEKRLFSASPDAHRRLLAAFVEAASAGNIDAVMVTDGGA